MSEEQTGKVEDIDDESKHDPYEGWLTLDQVCEVLGLSAPSISRKATSGELRRAKVGKVYMYDPASIQPSSKAPQADVVAATAAATAGVMRSLSDMVPELLRQNLAMCEKFQVGMARLVDQLTERCAFLEKTNTDMLMTREAYLDGRNDREIAIKQAEWGMAQKEKILTGVAENGPALLELLALLLKKDVPEDEPTPIEVTNVTEDSGDSDA